MTVGAALEQWRARNRATEVAAESRLLGVRLFWVRLGPVRIPVPHPNQLQWHDLHHLVLGYETDLVGEIEISAFELRTGAVTPMVFLLCIAGVLLGCCVAPRRTARAFCAARGWRNLYGSTTAHEEILRWPKTALRDWMRNAAGSPAGKGDASRSAEREETSSFHGRPGEATCRSK